MIAMRSAILDYFGALVAEDDGLPLTETALSLAQDAYTSIDLQRILTDIDELAERLKRAVPPDSDVCEKIGALNHFFFHELGFGCNLNDYYDPDNSYLNIVLERRRGIPISLAVLYMEIGEQMGLKICGVSFPGHFLLRIPLLVGDVILDPTTGQSLSEAQMIEMLEPYLIHSEEPLDSALHRLLRPAMPREIVARMLHNLKAVYWQEQQWTQLLAVQERLVILLPERIEEIRDRGLVYAQLDCVRFALHDLEDYLTHCPDADDAMQIQSQMQELRQRMH